MIKSTCKDIRSKSIRIFSTARRRLARLKHPPEGIGNFLSNAALIRLESSFLSVSTLTKKGYNFEAISICRTILEQMAWVYSVYDKGNDVEYIFKQKPQKCINNLKKLFPNCGRLYGTLSNFSHIYPNVMLNYIDDSDFQNSNTLYIRAHGDNGIELICLTFFLIESDIYSTMVEVVNSSRFRKLKYIQFDDKKKIILRRNSDLYKIVPEFVDQIQSINEIGERILFGS